MRQRGLADAGQVLDQQVTAGKQADEGQTHLVALAEEDAVDLGDAARQGIAQFTVDQVGIGVPGDIGVRHGFPAAIRGGARVSPASLAGAGQGIDIPDSRSKWHKAISGKPISAVGSLLSTRSESATPRRSTLKLPAQSSGRSMAR